MKSTRENVSDSRNLIYENVEQLLNKINVFIADVDTENHDILSVIKQLFFHELLNSLSFRNYHTYGNSSRKSEYNLPHFQVTYN